MGERPIVAILAGSDSDLPQLDGCMETLKKVGIPHEVLVASAHRTPDKVREYVLSARGRGIRVFVAAAGGAAHLAGMIAAHTTLPVIGIPMPSSPLAGVDSLYATVQMPPGVPVATVSIGAWGATNAAVLAAEILALSDPALEMRLPSLRAEAAAKIEEANRKRNPPST